MRLDRNYKKTFFLLLFLNLAHFSAIGQGRPRNIPTNPYPNTPVAGTEFGNPENVIDSLEEYYERDSFIVSYYYASSFRNIYPYTDSTFSTQNMWYDKANNPYNFRLNLGNNGSASIPAIYDIGNSTGFNTGFRQYDQYKIIHDSLKFYNSNRPMADLSFSPIMGSQENFTVGANYAQNYSDGFSLSVNFHRINQEGFYENSTTKSTNLGIAIRKNWNESRFTSFISMTSNVNEDLTNGGVTSDSLLNLPNYNFRTRIPVFLSGATNRYDEKSFNLMNYYRLGDTIENQNDFYLLHSLAYDDAQYKFFDKSSEGRNNFYNERFAFDDRGLRMFLGVNKVKNTFAAFGSYKNKFSGQIGVFHEFISIKNDTENNTRNDITAFGIGQLTLFKNFQIKVNARLGLGSNIGKFDINGSSDFAIGRWAKVNFGAKLYNLESPYIYSNFAINGTQIYNNERLNQAGLQIFGALSIPYTNTSVSISQNVMNNAVVWDSISIPLIIEGGLIQAVAKVSQDFHWKGFHSENFGVLQGYNSELIRLPSWYTYHNIYWRGQIFKKILDLKLGAEHMIIPNFKGMNYVPHTGQFVNQDIDIPMFNQTNFFLQGKISKFQIFVKYENLEHALNGQVNFQVGTYPQLDSRIRFGIKWLILD